MRFFFVMNNSHMRTMWFIRIFYWYSGTSPQEVKTLERATPRAAVSLGRARAACRVSSLYTSIWRARRTLFVLLPYIII